jgi:hypothetical protein
MALSDSQREMATVYAGIPVQTRIQVMHDLMDFAETQSDPLVASGVRLAASRVIRQGTRLEREKRRKA